MANPKMTAVSYENTLQQRLKKSGLPEDLYFSVKKWQQELFPTKNRQLFFDSNGFFRQSSPQELGAIREELGLDDEKLPLAPKTKQLFKGILTTMSQLSQSHQEKARQAVRTFGLYAEKRLAEEEQPSQTSQLVLEI